MISFVCAAVAGVQVFNLTKTLPVEPYAQSGPKLLTRNTTRQAWKATFQLMKGGTKRVAMLGVPGIGKSRNLALGLWHLVTGQQLEGIPQPQAIVFEARQSSSPRAGEPVDVQNMGCCRLPVPEEHQQLVPSGCFPGRQPHNVGCQDSDRLQP